MADPYGDGNGVIAVRKHNYMTPHQRERALRSLELYLEGNTWPKIKEKGGLNWGDFSRLLAEYPDLSKAYQEARKSSAHSFEDKALELAGELTAPNEFTGTQVRAHEVAMNQYRWSASRRNPTEYAEAGANKVSLVVPIQINSSLNLAEGGGEEEKQAPDAYQAAFEIGQAEPVEAQDAIEVESEPDNAPSPSLSPLEAVATKLGLPAEVPKAVPRRPSPGRPRKRHKDAAHTSSAAAKYGKKALKNPVVARALGLDQKEASDGGADTRIKRRTTDNGGTE